MDNCASTKQRTLIIIPSVASSQDVADAASNRSPMPDYRALQQKMNADLLDASILRTGSLPWYIRIAARASVGAALALVAFGRRKDYDIMFSNAENIGIPLALLLRLRGRPPVHAMIGHRLTAGKKRMLLRAARSRIDCVFVYSELQKTGAQKLLRGSRCSVQLIPFHADHCFFHPMARPEAEANCLPTLCSAGLEWRDYPTLIKAVENLAVRVLIGAHSPWSRHKSGIEGDAATLPPCVSVNRYNSEQLRTVYSQSDAVVVPLKENDFQAGITVILEAMAMGRPVITTRTQGMAPGLVHKHNCILTPPGDALALRQAIQWVLDSPAEAESMGARARAMLEGDDGMNLERWTASIANTLTSLASASKILPHTAAAD